MFSRRNISFLNILQLAGIASLLLLFSCNSIDSESYISYCELEENGLRESHVLGDEKYTFQFKTPEYIVCKEGRGDDPIRLTELENTIWFNIYISKELSENSNLPSDSNSEKRLTYFLSQAENNIKLFADGSSLPKIAYLFEKGHGGSETGVIIIGFKAQAKVKENIELIYTDKLFNSGEIKLTIKPDVINNIPKLKV